MKKKLDSNYTRMLRAILKKFWRQHPTKQLLYGHLPPITKTIQVRLTRHAGYYLKSRDKLISDILQCTPSHRQAKARRPARTYIQQLCADTGYSLEGLQGAMDDRDWSRERIREIHAGSMTWCWWWLTKYTFLPFYFLIRVLILSFDKVAYNLMNTKCFKKFDIIWDVPGFSENLLLFHNLITWPILVQMISNFNSKCKNNTKFSLYC